MRRQTLVPLMLLILFITAWLPRAVGLDVFVTPDERKWLARSANFYQAVTHNEWQNTFQREHPGVTVMWAGTLGFLQQFPEYPQLSPGQFTWEVENLERWLLENSTHTPIEMLAAGRGWIVLFIAVALAVCFFPLRSLFGVFPALIALLFAILDPFHIALSRQLHPDGLSASLSFVALLLLVTWLYGGRKTLYLVLSAVVMALAWLTKSPTILLVPVAGLLGLVEWWRGSEKRDFQGLLKIALPMVGWGLLTTALFFALWPSMWVQPLQTLQLMAVETSDYVEHHVNANYFMGQPTNDPGAIFYIVAYLFRATPLTLIGLVMAGVAAWKRFAPFDTLQRRQATGALVAFAVIFAIIITVGAKKFDRYLLPSFLPLDVLAGLGWMAILQVVVQARPAIQKRFANVPALLGIGVLLLHAVPGLLTAPYYLTYYNPLVGGSLTAPKVLFVGWGEGLDEAARWLNEQPDAENLRVHSWYADGPFSYFFKGNSEILTNFSPLVWLDTDYAVLYVNQWQRESPSPEALEWFGQQPAAHTVWEDGLELARVYDLRNSSLPPFLDWTDDRRADFGGVIRLAGYKIEKPEAQPGDTFQITLYEKALAPMDIDYNVLVRLVDVNSTEIWRSEGYPWGAPTTDWDVRDSRPDGHTVTIPADAPEGLYKLVMSFYDPATFQSLPITEAGTDTPTGEGERVVDFIRVGDAPAAETPIIDALQFGDVAKIVGITLPATATVGETVIAEVEWQSVSNTATDYTVFVHLIAPDGTQVSQDDRQPLDNFAPTHLWDPGERFLDPHPLTLPADAPAGTYEVRVGLYTQEGGRLPVGTGSEVDEYLPASVSDDFITLGTIEVAP